MSSARRLIIAVTLLFVGCNQRLPAGGGSAAAATSAAVLVRANFGAEEEPEPRGVAGQPCRSRPNILILILDTVRADATELDARSTNQTPVLKSLAARGVNFTHAYSTWDSTPPSHFSILTGYVNGHQTEIDQPEASIAFQLRKLGYRTFGVVANGNLSTRFMRSVMPFGSYTNVQEQWEAMPAAARAPLLPPIDALIRHYDSEPNEWYRMFVYSSADEILRRLEAKLDGKRPFLGFVNILDPHDPYFPSPAGYDISKDGPRLEGLRYRTLPPELANPDGIPDPERRAYIKAMITKAQGRAWSVAADLTPEQLRVYRRRYDAEVRETDAAVGRIIEALRRRGVLDNTVLVITSDHGEAFGEGGLLTHSFDNGGDREATNRVNLLMVFPPCYGLSDIRIDQSCTIADIVPTLYELLGLDASPLELKTTPGNFGRSLLSLMVRPPVTLLPVMPPPTPVSDAVTATVPEHERKRQDREAIERFRSLGYLQ
ncbi:MAG TPA: sulfatase [Thermoanaerobaculia bacterium]|nr:sulfatase [Thermoanaerobaculia bacterium]